MQKIDHVIQYTQETCAALASGFWAKCLGAIGILLVQFSFGSIGFQIILAVILLIIIDTITGIVGAYKQKDPRIKGQMAVDATYLYICVDTDTWTRVALAW